MQFLFPAFIIAGLAILVPILIHLFNFRRFKKIYFSNVSFLKNIQQTSNSKRKLQRWLVLASRCLALLALVLAFMQPYISGDGKSKGGLNYSIIYIDNSQSMGLEGLSSNLLDEAKIKAINIIKGYGANDKFKIVTNNSSFGSGQWLNIEEALSKTDEVSLSAERKLLSHVFNGQKQSLAMAGQGKKNLYILSDFQKSGADLNKIKDTTLVTYLVPIHSPYSANVSIDTCYFDNNYPVAGQNNQMIFSINNYGQKDVTVKPVLKNSGINKPLTVQTLKAGQSYRDTIPLLNKNVGFQNAELLINDSPVNFDDNYFISWEVPESASILILNNDVTDQYLMAALDASGLFKVRNEQASKVNFSQFSNYQLIVLNRLDAVSSGMLNELMKAIDSGVNIAIFPGPNASGLMNQVSNQFKLNVSGRMINANKQVFGINTHDYIFSNVFEGKVKQLKLPMTFASYPISAKNSRGAVSLLDFRDGSSFLIRVPRGTGNLYLCASPLDINYSDLVKNGEIIVPFLFKAALSTNRKEALSMVIGKSSSIDVLTEESVVEGSFKFKGPQTFIPEQLSRQRRTTINTGNETILPGVYGLEDKTGKSYGQYAFNYDRSESEMSFHQFSELEKFSSDHLVVMNPSAQADLTSLVKEGDTGISLWKYCLALALFFLLMETFLLRYFK